MGGSSRCRFISHGSAPGHLTLGASDERVRGPILSRAAAWRVSGVSWTFGRSGSCGRARGRMRAGQRPGRKGRRSRPTQPGPPNWKSSPSAPWSGRSPPGAGWSRTGPSGRWSPRGTAFRSCWQGRSTRQCRHPPTPCAPGSDSLWQGEVREPRRRTLDGIGIAVIEGEVHGRRDEQLDCRDQQVEEEGETQAAG